MAWIFNQALNDNMTQLVPKHILVDDILAAVSYQFGLFYGIGDVDDIDHYGQPPPALRGRAFAEPDSRGHVAPGARREERMAIQDLSKARRRI